VGKLALRDIVLWTHKQNAPHRYSDAEENAPSLARLNPDDSFILSQLIPAFFKLRESPK
jgi:hypothetical protein